MKSLLLIIALLFLAASAKAMVPVAPEDSGKFVMVGESVDGLGDFIYGPCQIDPDYDNCTFTYHDHDNFRFILYHGAPGIQVLFTPKKIGLFRDTVTIHIAFHSNVFSCNGTVWETSRPFVYHSISDSITRMIPQFSYTHMRYDSIIKRYKSLDNCSFELMNNVDDSTLFYAQLLPYSGQLSKSVLIKFDSTNDSAITLQPKIRRITTYCYLITDTMQPFLHDTLVKYKLNCGMVNRSTDSLFQWSGSTLYFDSVPRSVNIVKKKTETSALPTVLFNNSGPIIALNIEIPSYITLSISDITGRTIDHICTNKFYQPGSYTIDYTPHMPSGQYFLTYATNSGTKVVPFIYLR
ncbi:MAG TPA: hypothetical protein VFO76_13875 [Candidatus Kapabacteria bacterium]|nr:hypothetical protein [Candidatus Kapabacteria bacterium]